MSETSPETGPPTDVETDVETDAETDAETKTEPDDAERLDAVAGTIQEGHEAAGQLADQNIIDPDAETATKGDGDDVAPDDPS